MPNIKQIQAINKAIAEYFDLNRDLTVVPAKDLMPTFIAAGIFSKDEKKGLPIRKLCEIWTEHVSFT